MRDIVPYEPSRLEEVKRIWKEVGWILEDNYEPLELFLEGGVTHLGLLRGEAECSVITLPADFLYLGEKLPMTVVAAVTTSLIARRQGLAGRATAEAIRAGAERGDLVASLGVFDTGYYDRFGFASMPYSRHHTFDPAQLLIRERVPAPLRISRSESEAVHESRARRLRCHGSATILTSRFSAAAMAQRKDSIGLGYSGEGGYTHHFWGHIKGEHGPLDIYWMAYETLDQLRELLALLYSLGDQIHLVRMLEPPGIVLQDFLETPFRHQRATQDAALGHAVHSAAEAQIRILDLPEAVRRLSLPGSIEINLTLTDPVARYLEDRRGWRGCAGEYHLRLASHSEATAGHRAGAPEVGMDVGAFSQLWCGARSPEHLATQQKLRTDAKTLSRLAELFRLPRPDFDWIF